MEKFLAILSLFRKGSEVGNPESWKTGQVTANAVGGFILALVTVANDFGANLPVSDAQALAIGGGFFALVNVVLTVVTSKRAGLPAKQPELPPDDSTRTGA